MSVGSSPNSPRLGPLARLASVMFSLCLSLRLSRRFFPDYFASKRFPRTEDCNAGQAAENVAALDPSLPAHA